jgi:hypothetical protein
VCCFGVVIARLNLRLQLLEHLLQLGLVALLLRPADAQTLLLSRLGDDVDVDVVDLLVRETAVVLQDVVLLGSRGAGDLGGNGQEVGKAVVGDVGEGAAVMFRDDELDKWSITDLGLAGLCEMVMLSSRC